MAPLSVRLTDRLSTMDRLLAAKKTAQHLSIGKSILWLRLKSVVLPLCKGGQRARRFHLEDVEALVRRRS